jgi:hypothetical protein
MDVKELRGRVWAGLVWLRIGTDGFQKRTFSLPRRRVVEKLMVCQPVNFPPPLSSGSRKCYYNYSKSPPFFILNHINPVHIHITYFVTNFNIISGCRLLQDLFKCSLPFIFTDNILYAFLAPSGNFKVGVEVLHF